MTPTEAQRFELHEKLIEVLKEKATATLMESLPPMDWNELATKEDLGVLRKDLEALEVRVNTRFDSFRVELGAKIDTGLAGVRGEMKLGFARQTYVILAGVAAAITPIYIALFTGAAG